MILIEMFRGAMGLSTQIFAKFFTPNGADTHKKNFEFLLLRTLGGHINFFLVKVRILVITIFRKLKKFFEI